MRARSGRFLLAAALTLAAAACDGGGGGAGGGTLPGTEPLQLTLVGGSDQQGAPGEQLAQLLVVRATRNGLPVADVEVSFTPAQGSGTVQSVKGLTNASGEAFAFWRLPLEPAQSFSLTASAQGADPVRFRSTLLPPERLDVVYAEYAGPVHLWLFARDQFPEDDRLFSATLRDSMLLAPFADPRQRNEAVAFAVGHPPLITAVGWTSARDSLRLQFQPKVRVPLTLWVVDGPWEETAALARTQVERAREIWRQAGIELDVTLVDATHVPGAERYQDVMVEMCENDVAPTIGTAPGQLNAYYVWDIYNTKYQVGGQGVHCGGGRIELAAGDTRSPSLLGHEVGHAFSLDHSSATLTDNVMHWTAMGTSVTHGQWFRAHFYTYSTIQSMKFTPNIMQARACHQLLGDNWFNNTAPCPSENFD